MLDLVTIASPDSPRLEAVNDKVEELRQGEHQRRIRRPGPDIVALWAPAPERHEGE